MFDPTNQSHARPPRTRRLAALALALAFASTGCNELRTDGTSGSRDEMADALATDGQAAIESGNLDNALDLFTQALASNPRHVDSHIGVGDIYQIKGDYESAAGKYKTARDIEPQNYDANYKLGLMMHLLNRVREAVKSYLDALTINPDSFEANMNLGTAYLQLSEPSLALPYAERATKLDGTSQPAFVNLGVIYAAVGRHEDAVMAYRAAADRGDLSPQIAVNLVNALIKTKKYERAANVLRTLGAREQRTEYHERLGYVYFKQGKFDDSLIQYRKALEAEPDDPAALNGLGVNLMTRYIRGRRLDIETRDEALNAWRRSLRANAKQPRIADLIARYSKL